MAKLPDDILLDMFLRLPVKSLLRFESVSKSWLSLITDPEFAKKHFDCASEVLLLSRKRHVVYSIDYNTSSDETEPVKIEINPSFRQGKRVEVVGSSNGLVCITYSVRAVCLWNPSTKEIKQLPRTRTRSQISPRILFGFAYDPTIDNYKVVKIDYSTRDSWVANYCEVQVYTLATDSWRRIKILDIPFHFGGIDIRKGIHVSGSLHWLAQHRLHTMEIISFDLKGEVFKVVPHCDSMESGFTQDSFMNLVLGVLGGLLCRSDSFSRVDRVDIWVMKEYGVKSSWTKQYTIVLPASSLPFRYLVPMCFTKSGEILLRKDCNEVVLYDPECDRYRILKVRGVPSVFDMYYEPFACMVGSSLVPLGPSTYVEQVPTRGKASKRRRLGS